MKNAYIVFKHEFPDTKKMRKTTMGYFTKEKDANDFISNHLNGDYETSIMQIEICEKLTEHSKIQSSLRESAISKLTNDEIEALGLNKL